MSFYTALLKGMELTEPTSGRYFMKTAHDLFACPLGAGLYAALPEDKRDAFVQSVIDEAQSGTEFTFFNQLEATFPELSSGASRVCPVCQELPYDRRPYLSMHRLYELVMHWTDTHGMAREQVIEHIRMIPELVGEEE